MALKSILEIFSEVWWENFRKIIEENFAYLLSLITIYPVYEDLYQTVSTENMFNTPGKVDFDFDNFWIVMQSSGLLTNEGDIVFHNYQLKHSVKDDSLFKLHIHWVQSNNSVRTISGKYRIQKNGAGTTVDWTNFSATTQFGNGGGNIFDTSSWNFGVNGNFDQVTQLAEIPLLASGLSAIIQVVICRTDSEVASDIYLMSMDGHVEKDSEGSRTEYSK